VRTSSEPAQTHTLLYVSISWSSAYAYVNLLSKEQRQMNPMSPDRNKPIPVKTSTTKSHETVKRQK